MRNSVHLSLLAMMLACICGATSAADVPKGALVVRYGAANADDSYENQLGNPDNLQAVSAVCSPDNKGVTQENIKALILTDNTRPSSIKQAGATNASTLINQGARVVQDRLSGNPNHCLISNISRSKIKGAWTQYSSPLQ